MPARNRLEYGPVGFVTNALALGGGVEERLGAEISLVPKFRITAGVRMNGRNIRAPCRRVLPGEWFGCRTTRG